MSSVFTSGYHCVTVDIFHIYVKLSDNIKSSGKPERQPALVYVSQRREAADRRFDSHSLLIFPLICLLGLTYILVKAL